VAPPNNGMQLTALRAAADAERYGAEAGRSVTLGRGQVRQSAGLVAVRGAIGRRVDLCFTRDV
jgi:hypothetical protein